jgi:hypothetical protein
LRIKFFFLISLLISTLHSYQSEDNLKAVIIGKIAKFVEWEDKESSSFVITVLGSSSDTKLFEGIYQNKRIGGRSVEIKSIESIDELGFTHILYVSKISTDELVRVITETKFRNILTVSGMRGFAEKGGTVQLYFVSRKIKLKVNVGIAEQQKLIINPALLQIATIVKG